MTTTLNTPVLRYAAFDSEGSGGNPAGVVLDAAGLGDSQMQSIAADVGYSETAFLTRDETGTRRIRYFSPRSEVAFCGHATLATAVALAERGGTGELRLSSPAGDITVHTEASGERVRATMTSPPTSVHAVAPDDLATALAALGWSPAELDPDLPTRVANAGNNHLVLAAATRQRLAALDYDQATLGALMARRDWTTVHLVSRVSQAEFHARDPFPTGGVVEDPATGAAAAAFGGYLRELGLAAPEQSVVVHQGADMGSPSRLDIGITPQAAAGIHVSGTARLIGGDR